tara:strand:- start:1054 stop:1305 length:252 start_codon:yes stop_codon:yes gene_type:complete
MEWLQENLLAPVIAALLGWFWYDKRLRDVRLQELEQRIQAAEKRAETHEGDGRVLAEKMDGLSELFETQLKHIQKSLDRLEDR